MFVEPSGKAPRQWWPDELDPEKGVDHGRLPKGSAEDSEV